jgi:hypothetical protein
MIFTSPKKMPNHYPELLYPVHGIGKRQTFFNNFDTPVKDSLVGTYVIVLFQEANQNRDATIVQNMSAFLFTH